MPLPPYRDSKRCPSRMLFRCTLWFQMLTTMVIHWKACWWEFANRSCYPNLDFYFLQPTPVQVLCRNNLRHVTFKVINFAVRHLYVSSILKWPYNHIEIPLAALENSCALLRGWVRYGNQKGYHTSKPTMNFFSSISTCQAVIFKFRQKLIFTSFCLKNVRLLTFYPYYQSNVFLHICLEMPIGSRSYATVKLMPTIDQNRRDSGIFQTGLGVTARQRVCLC